MGRRQQAGALAGVFAVCALAYGLVFVTDFVRMTDNQAYVLLGRGLAEGRGYVTYWGGEPTPHTHYPPGYPAILAAAMRLGVTSILGLKLLNGAMLALGLGLTAVWATRVFGNRTLAVVAVAAVGLNATLLLYGSLLMSEVAFLAVSMGALVCALQVERAGDSARVWTDWRLYLLLVLLIAAFYIRTVGVALIAGCVGGMLVDGRRKAAAVLAVGALAGTAPWMLYVHRLGNTSYMDYIGPTTTHGESGGNHLLWRLADNAAEYGSHVFPVTLVPGLAPAFDLHRGVGWVVTGALLVAGGWGLAHAGRQKAVLAAYLACTAYVLLLWPSVYITGRFLIPVVPVVTALVLRGLWEAGRRCVRGGALTPWALTPLLLLSVPALGTARAYAADPRVPERQYETIAAAVLRDARPGERVTTRYPASMYYLTGVTSRAFRYTSDPDHMVFQLEKEGIDLVVVTTDGSNDPSLRFLVPAIQAHPDRFVLLEAIARLPPQPPLAYPYAIALYRFGPSRSDR